MAMAQGQPQQQEIHDAWTHLLGWASLVGTFLAGGATAFLAVLGVDVSLVAATGVLSGFISFFYSIQAWWGRMSRQDKAENAAQQAAAQQAAAHQPVAQQVAAQPQGVGDKLPGVVTTGAGLAVTVQGVVLGFIFAFFKEGSMTLTVKVAVTSLAFGVAVGLLLVNVASISIPGRRTRKFASLLFTIAMWTFTYGLTCLVSSVM
ncbi:hypothetical protein ACIP4Y_26615 [Streptomyces sp. NPDC088810]|uniref:hypothetical protein n=1 Tax=Streptomyces sp. NPDC088810 TaxID=3365904 RepID=UPI0037FC4CDC